jgi:hypothetical protein
MRTQRVIYGILGAGLNGYNLVIVSSVGFREGMALELAADDGTQIAEVFEDEATKARTVRFFVDTPVPLEAVEWLLRRAEVVP